MRICRADAEALFGRFKAFSDEEMEEFAHGLHLLKTRGLKKLIDHLYDLKDTKEFSAAVAEYNIARTLLNHCPKDFKISYEVAQSNKRSIDFKVENDTTVFWLQVKSASQPEEFNRPDRTLRDIARKVQTCTVPKFYSCTLSNNFNPDNVEALSLFIRENACSASENKIIAFPGPEKPTAKIMFWSPSSPSTSLPHLTCGGGGMDGFVEIVKAKKKIADSLQKSAAAFQNRASGSCINLICQKVYPATKSELLEVVSWLFLHEFSGNVTGVVVIEGNGWKPYNTVDLLINDSFSHCLENIKTLLPIRNVILCRNDYDEATQD